MAEIKETLRFAPSPTGYMHAGGVRTALFNWLLAKRTGGEFHLRIEDTDRARLVEGAENHIKESLEWLGLGWDGLIIRQSERVEQGIYMEYAKQLVENDWAYVADETPEELAGIRKARQEAVKANQPLPKYPSKEKDISFSKFKLGEGMAIRFKWPDAPKPMEITYFDAAKPWQTSFNPKSAPSAFEDFVLLKADGFPTYNFAHVIDDYDLGVTRVIRGDEYTSSLNKHVALHEALGWKLPKYNHVPLILSVDKAALSKRHGARDVLAYREQGYLATALANFLILIGWSPGGDRELFFSLNELAEAFSLDGIQKSPGVFNVEKLNWMNSEHLKQMDAGAVLAEAKAAGFWKGEETVRDAAVIGLALERSKTLKDLAEYRESYFYRRPKVPKTRLVGDENPESVGVWLEKVQRQLGGLPEKDWKTDTLHDQLTDVLEELGLKPKQLYPVLREALTAEPKTPALWDIMAVLDKAESLARLEAAAALVA